jgi:hypothetical protein
MSPIPQLAGDILLEHLESSGQDATLRLAYQKVKLLGHEDVSCHVESVPASRPLQKHLKRMACRRCPQQWRAVITTELNTCRSPVF